MAHADYSCCALCDCKLAFGVERTKEDLCITCLKSLRKFGVPALDPKEFIEWAKSSPIEIVRRALSECAYHPCPYGNEFDAAISDILGKEG
jgi:hypothetical protein